MSTFTRVAELTCLAVATYAAFTSQSDLWATCCICALIIGKQDRA